MKDYAQKALNVLIQQASTKKVIKSLSQTIGDSLELCRKKNQDKDDLNPFDPHLFKAYEKIVIVDDFYADVSYRSNEEVIEFLQNCHYCLAAHQAVQDRKKWKKKLAILRGIATKIGNAAK